MNKQGILFHEDSRSFILFILIDSGLIFMTLSSKFQSNYPDAWDKVQNDNAFEAGTSVKLNASGSYRTFDTTADAVTYFLDSRVDDGPDPKDILSNFFRLNKCIGKVGSLRSGCTANMAIMAKSYVETAKIGLSHSSSSLERSPAYQFDWELKANRELGGGDYEKVVQDAWHLFCAGSKIRWCFEVRQREVNGTNAHCLNCRLSLSDYSKGKSHILLELSPSELKKPTALDAGGNLYEYWLFGGNTAVRSGCETLDVSEGVPEFVFQPDEVDLKEVICDYVPCRNFAK